MLSIRIYYFLSSLALGAILGWPPREVAVVANNKSLRIILYTSGRSGDDMKFVT